MWRVWLYVVAVGVTIFSCACGVPRSPLLPRIAPALPSKAMESVPANEPANQSATLADRVPQAFFSYRNGGPQVAEITPGTAVSRDNWQIAQEVLSRPMLDAVREGEITILVQETSDVPASAEYINATREYAGDVTLDQEGNLVQYRAGLPFPSIEPTDPQAGLKVAWNTRYADSGDNVQRWESLQVRNRDGQYQLGFSFFYARAYGMHRAKPERNIPAWEAEDILYKEFMQVLHPVPGISIHPLLGLVHLRYWRDAEARPVAQWYVMGFLSINRLRTLVYNPQASAWQFPVLYEDLFGAYLHTYQWRLLETRVALVPGFVKGTEPIYGGLRAGYPLDPWELRTVHVVEAVPRTPEHPYGRKVFYFDHQTFAPLYVLIFDREGKLWRIGFMSYAHFSSYPGTKDLHVPILIGRSWIDFALDRVTLSLITDASYNQPLSPDFFTPANMIRKGK
jgi:hypothetical protein